MRNPLHALCPYFAMFPESFVQKQLLAYSRPGENVFDPFCGRGTTILEALLNDRQSIGIDINPVAACVAGAKAEVPDPQAVHERIKNLARKFEQSGTQIPYPNEFFRWCFSENTFSQVVFLKYSLSWKHDAVDRFIAAVALGVLHGEAHKTELCLSNRMPRTISTKPEYSVRWWKARNLSPPERDVFRVLQSMVNFRFAGDIPKRKGQVVLGDARGASDAFPEHKESVSLVITSPPYLDTTDYAEDQWLRLWFLGGPERPSARLHRDDRHTQKDAYWAFIAEAWRGCTQLLREKAHLVVRIGGSTLDKGNLFEGLMRSLEIGLSGRAITPLHEGESSIIRKRQTNSFRPGTSNNKVEHDFAFILTA